MIRGERACLIGEHVRHLAELIKERLSDAPQAITELLQVFEDKSMHEEEWKTMDLKKLKKDL